MHMKKLLLVALIFPGISIMAQETYYYYGVNEKPVDSISQARNYKVVKQKGENRYKITSYSLVNDEWIFSRVEKARPKIRVLAMGRHISPPCSPWCSAPCSIPSSSASVFAGMPGIPKQWIPETEGDGG